MGWQAKSRGERIFLKRRSIATIEKTSLYIDNASLDKLLQLSALLSVEQVGAATEMLLVDKDVRHGPLVGLFLQVSLSNSPTSNHCQYTFCLSPSTSMIGTYLNIGPLRTHSVELEDTDLALIEAELVDHALGLGAVGAVTLAEHSNEVLRDELFSNLLGGHLAGVVELGPGRFGSEHRRGD